MPSRRRPNPSPGPKSAGGANRLQRGALVFTLIVLPYVTMMLMASWFLDYQQDQKRQRALDEERTRRAVTQVIEEFKASISQQLAEHERRQEERARLILEGQRTAAAQMDAQEPPGGSSPALKPKGRGKPKTPHKPPSEPPVPPGCVSPPLICPPPFVDSMVDWLKGVIPDGSVEAGASGWGFHF